METTNFETEATIKLKYFHRLASATFIVVSLFSIATIIAVRLHLNNEYLRHEVEQVYKENCNLKDANRLLSSNLIYYKKQVLEN